MQLSMQAERYDHRGYHADVCAFSMRLWERSRTETWKTAPYYDNLTVDETGAHCPDDKNS